MYPLKSTTITSDSALRETLLRWAKHLASSEVDQIALVERTIAVALEEPDTLLSSTVERGLMMLMLRIVCDDAGNPPVGTTPKGSSAPGP
ncbi:hypothetical protein SAMN03159496_04607 [Rhizobium sp. NFR07]|nr:hypothetical protein SAMN03159496_04607 [Rhizobium sp. NFR07]